MNWRVRLGVFPVWKRDDLAVHKGVAGVNIFDKLEGRDAVRVFDDGAFCCKWGALFHAGTILQLIEMVEDVGGVVSAFVGKRIPGGDRGFDKASAIGFVENGELIGGLVYHDYQPEAGIVEISAASTSKRWLTRRTLFAVFSIPFDRWGCQMVVMRTRADNQQENGRGIARIARAYGFTQTLIPRLYGRNADCILHCLTEEAWRQNGYH
jgi:RimJ/RimL family protein N-acetyltransferase